MGGARILLAKEHPDRNYGGGLIAPECHPERPKGAKDLVMRTQGHLGASFDLASLQGCSILSMPPIRGLYTLVTHRTSDSTAPNRFRQRLNELG